MNDSRFDDTSQSQSWQEDEQFEESVEHEEGGADAQSLAVSGEEGQEENQAAGEAAQQYLEIENRFQSGANWFFWIAALSLVNTLLIIFGSDRTFIVGLGITQIIDYIFVKEFEVQMVGKMILLGFDIIVALFICLFGFLARKRQIWAFILGMILYAMDGLLFLFLGDFLSFAFHVFALFCIFSGMRACMTLRSIDAHIEQAMADDRVAEQNPVEVG